MIEEEAEKPQASAARTSLEDALFEQAEPLDAYAMVYSFGGYTTNLAIEDLTDGKAWVVTEHEGEPLPRAHGGPARLLVPHLYFWKSAKWVAGLRVMSRPTTSPASGRRTATTTAVTRGRRSAIGRTDRPSPSGRPASGSSRL